MKKSKKKKLVLTIILLSIIVLVLLMGIIIRIIDNKFREDIKKHYNTYVKLIDNTNIYKKDKDKLAQYTKILYNQARLIEGLPIENPTELASLICEKLSE